MNIYEITYPNGATFFIESPFGLKKFVSDFSKFRGLKTPMGDTIYNPSGYLSINTRAFPHELNPTEKLLVQRMDDALF